jgi:four helix bundle protein
VLRHNLQFGIYNLQSEPCRSSSTTLISRAGETWGRTLASIVLLTLVMTSPSYPAYGQDLRDRAFQFECNIVRFSDAMWKQGGCARVLAPQIVRCGTSIGANLEEARGGESRRDFISKCAISLKEAREAHYRLRVAGKTGLGPPDVARALTQEAGEIAAILGAIVRNARRNAIAKALFSVSLIVAVFFFLSL